MAHLRQNGRCNAISFTSATNSFNLAHCIVSVDHYHNREKRTPHAHLVIISENIKSTFF